VVESDSFKAAKEKYKDLLNNAQTEIAQFELENQEICKVCGSKSNSEFNCVANGVK